MKAHAIPTHLAARITSMQRQGFTAPNIIRTLRLTPAQVIEYHLAPPPGQPCGHPLTDIGGDDREGTHYCTACADDAA